MKPSPLKPPNLEKKIGIFVYATNTKGIGGRIKKYPSDFMVQEILDKFGMAPLYPKPKKRISGSGKHLLTILIKKRWDTMLALKALSEELYLTPAKIGFAGLKDTTAITSQFITLKGIAPELLNKINLKGIKPIARLFIKEKITSKNIIGNKFKIRISDLKISGKEITTEIEKTYQQLNSLGGIPNFYGHQRFGTVRPLTHLVGKKILERKFDEAVELYLTETFSYESPDMKRVRFQLKEEGDLKKAYKNFPKKNVYEKLLLRHLIRKQGDYLGALKSLPHTLRQLFIHAYQSYLFNKTLSLRIQNIGLNRLIEGDWVTQILQKHNQELRLRRIRANIKPERDNVTLNLPIFGYKTFLSGGGQGEIEKKVLRDEGIKLKYFYIGSLPDISCEGEFRPALASIHNFTYKIKNHNSLELSFNLNKGSYATILLREIIKPLLIIETGF